MADDWRSSEAGTNLAAPTRGAQRLVARFR
jgi:hypothetical protein